MGSGAFFVRVKLIAVHDPTRIPAVMKAVQRVWEGQPDLSFPALMGLIANRGIGWGCSDEELMAVLERIEAEHPALIDAPSDHTLALTTLSPHHLVTLTPQVAIVRSGDDPTRIPGVWAFAGMRRTGPGLPLVVSDTAGIEHRLGVVQLVTRFDACAAPSLDGIVRRDVGAHRWLVELGEQQRCLVGQRIRLWRKESRTVTSTVIAWEEILSCRLGDEFEVAPVGGGPIKRLGPVTAIYLLEA